MLAHAQETPAGLLDVDARLATIVTEHRAHLVNRCTRLLSGDRALAEDVVQDVFLKLRRTLAEGQSIDNVRAWLRTASRNAAIDELRRRGPVVVGGSEPLADAIHVDDHLGGSDPDLEVAWNGLSSRHREILRLRELEGLRYEEIAQAMATRVTAIDALLFRARAALRREYARAASISAANPIALGAARSPFLRRGLDALGQQWRSLELRAGLLQARMSDVIDPLSTRVVDAAAAAVIVVGTTAGLAAPTLDIAPPWIPPVTAPSVPAVPAVPTTVTPPSVPPAPATPPAPEVPDSPTAPASPAPPAPSLPVVETVVESLRTATEHLPVLGDLTRQLEESSGGPDRNR